jgi:hypothetical protein
MAVVQISRIQVRRGQKNTGSGLPQLASGELGWAIDTRELYIGNGSVAEGSPAVGNTKILTEFDDIFSLADTYTYRVDDTYILTGTNASTPVERTLQDRLDDRVSVRAFGATGDGSTDDTASLQRAIDQTYLNAGDLTETSRIIMHIEPGVYRITGTIFLPPYVTLKGAGKDKTVIRSTSADPIFYTTNSTVADGDDRTDDSASSSLNQARNILIEGMTLERTVSGKGMVLQSCKNSHFKDIRLAGVWEIGDSVVTTDIGIEIIQEQSAVPCEHNKFENIELSGWAYGIYSIWDINYNSIKDSKFNTLGYGVLFGDLTGLAGRQNGPSDGVLQNSVFEDIERQAIWIVKGKRNLSTQNSFIDVGNDGAADSAKTPVHPVLSFGVEGNKSVDDFFGRTAFLSYGATNGTPYIPEISGIADFHNDQEQVVTITQSTNAKLFRLPQVINQSYEVEYLMVSANYRVIRSGKLVLTVDGYQQNVSISDEYQFTGDETYLNRITFNAILVDEDADTSEESIHVRVTSTMPSDDNTQFKYTIKNKKTDII